MEKVTSLIFSICFTNKGLVGGGGVKLDSHAEGKHQNHNSKQILVFIAKRKDSVFVAVIICGHNELIM